MIRILIASICLFFTCHVAEAAGFDCAKASTSREHLICASPQLSGDDSKLGAAYMTARKLLPSAGALALRSSELEWLGDLDHWCPMNGGRVATIRCLDQAYQSRIAAVGNEAVTDALTVMVSDPVAAKRVFEYYDTDLSKLGLALDLRLLLPDPEAHAAQIGQLLNSLVPPNFNDDVGGYDTIDYDGSIKSMVPYIIATSLDPGGVNLPLSCDLIVKFPVLLDGTIGGYGSSMDAMMPSITCDDSRFLPSKRVGLSGYTKILSDAEDASIDCGTQVYGVWSYHQYVDWIIYLLPAVLLDTAKYDGENVAYLRGLHEQLKPELLKIPLDAVPLSDWIYSTPEAYKYKNILTLFPEAEAELAEYYQTQFGFSADDAQVAARRGVWLLDDAVDWAKPGTADPLAKAILTQAPQTVVAAQGQAAAANGQLDSKYLRDAVVNPSALVLLLQDQPDLDGVDSGGITPLMEAAILNQSTSVKLLLAAGANVNAGDVSGQQALQNANYPCMDEQPRMNFEDDGPGAQTALMFAAADAGLPVIRLLVAAGADKKAKDGNGQTALVYLDQRLTGTVRAGVPLNQADAAMAKAMLAP